MRRRLNEFMAAGSDIASHYLFNNRKRADRYRQKLELFSGRGLKVRDAVALMGVKSDTSLYDPALV